MKSFKNFYSNHSSLIKAISGGTGIGMMNVATNTSFKQSETPKIQQNAGKGLFKWSFNPIKWFSKTPTETTESGSIAIAKNVLSNIDKNINVVFPNITSAVVGHYTHDYTKDFANKFLGETASKAVAFAVDAGIGVGIGALSGKFISGQYVTDMICNAASGAVGGYFGSHDSEYATQELLVQEDITEAAV